MTFSQPNPGQPAQNPAVAALTAPSAKAGDKLFIAGIAIAVLGLIVVIFSFLNWLTLSEEGVSGDATVSGLGTIESDGISISDAEFTSAAGGWTIAFGVIAILFAALLVVRRFQGYGAIGAAATGIASSIAAIVFAASTGSGVLDSDLADAAVDSGADLSTGFGLWIVLFGSLGLLVAAAYALALVVAPEKVGGSR